jgi:hypothetical protein
MLSGRLIYNQEQSRLELDGITLLQGVTVELNIFGFWISGQVEADASGWYLNMPNHAGIRLRPGLKARFPKTSQTHI